MHEAPAFLHDRVDRELTILLRPCAAEAQRFAEQQNLRQGCAQFVRDGRGEVCAQAHQRRFTPQLEQRQQRQQRRQHEQSDEQVDTR